MEWIFLYNILIMFSFGQEFVISLPDGVCREYQSIERSNANMTILVTLCCNHYHKKNGVCVACPIGYESRGEICTPCFDGLYGNKCAATCNCNATERCNHVKGCIAIDDKTMTNDITTQAEGQSNGQDAAITIREIILFVVITCFGLLIFGGLAFMCRKRQSRILITQHQEINQHREEIKTDNNRSKMQIQLIEEGSENVYDIIDESDLSKTLEPSNSRMQNSYLDVRYSPKIPMNVEDNLGIICIASVSSQSKMAQKTSLRRQRSGLEESIISCQGALVSAYSDGYLRPRSYEHHTGINKTMEKQETFCSNKDKMARKENDGCIYDEPAYDGINRAGNYDSLIFSKDTKPN